MNSFFRWNERRLLRWETRCCVMVINWSTLRFPLILDDQSLSLCMFPTINWNNESSAPFDCSQTFLNSGMDRVFSSQRDCAKRCLISQLYVYEELIQFYCKSCGSDQEKKSQIFFQILYLWRESWQRIQVGGQRSSSGFVSKTMHEQMEQRKMKKRILRERIKSLILACIVGTKLSCHHCLVQS